MMMACNAHGSHNGLNYIKGMLICQGIIKFEKFLIDLALLNSYNKNKFYFFFSPMEQ